MREACPECGGVMSKTLRSGDIHGAQSEQRLRRPNLIFACVECGKRTYRPPMVYEDGLEWFFDVWVWRALKALGAFIALLFLCQILGIVS